MTELSDRMSAYGIPIRKSKWYQKLAIELLLNASVVNALLMYKQMIDRKIKVTEFRMALAMHLTQCRDENPQDPAALNVSSRKTLPHEIEKKKGQAKKGENCTKKVIPKNKYEMRHLKKINVKPLKAVWTFLKEIRIVV
ncbi:hypothetical protein X777_12512 [Ooceraea biroi]|uniref:PiggyBac transposable element-derived protein domain-containing protein n=1 Tax=Ooceraea biroi TaxID=2015173 RepID=A0A026W007_OOCBI|nr:hypothetical protein X777_12512 [Ooceraea biroi]